MTTSTDLAELNNRLKGREPITILDVRRRADADADPCSMLISVFRPVSIAVQDQSAEPINR
jgi:hypothetical protein